MDPNTIKLLLAPVIVGLVEAAKAAGVPVKWLPLLSMALGAVGGPLIGVAYGSTNIALDVLTGFGVGAAATGIYAAVTSIGSGTTTVNAVAVPTGDVSGTGGGS